MKIIDYFAARVPLISTAKGIEGIPVVHGRQALVIDDWDETAAAIRQLILEPEKATVLADAAYEFARDLDWKSIAGRYIEVYDSL